MKQFREKYDIEIRARDQDNPRKTYKPGHLGLLIDKTDCRHATECSMIAIRQVIVDKNELERSQYKLLGI